ncbi:MAG TPA: FKBP-type peptidyl-prolyl cis-trans isomerase [Candidatus Lokiarchaeia archaeon]|nr:FKBP-type peptidyl-prolyl cis-trans isomerase [Candidatus Lokiarchaeia archaeon]
MPKKNPKHQARLERTQKSAEIKRKRVYNWRKIGGGILICAAVGTIIILAAIYAPQAAKQSAQAQQARAIVDGDQVYINYTLTLADGTVKDRAPTADGTLFTISKGQLITGFYNAVLGMHQGDEKTFTIQACPAHNCPNYDGYTSGDLAYQQLTFDVIIVRIV